MENTPSNSYGIEGKIKSENLMQNSHHKTQNPYCMFINFYPLYVKIIYLDKVYGFLILLISMSAEALCLASELKYCI